MKDHTAKVLSIAVWFSLDPPDVLLTDEDYRVCRACRGVVDFTDLAVASNPRTKDRGRWQHAIIVDVARRGICLKRVSDNAPVALA